MSEKAKELPAISDKVNAVLVPKVKKWLSVHFPDVHYSDAELSTLMCYATTPEDFKMPKFHEVLKVCKREGPEKAEDAIKMVWPDEGIVEIHRLMLKNPEATTATLQQFQHQDKLRKSKRKSLDRFLRAINTSGLSSKEIEDEAYEAYIRGEITEEQANRAYRRICEIRNEDLENIELKNIRFYE